MRQPILAKHILTWSRTTLEAEQSRFSTGGLMQYARREQCAVQTICRIRVTAITARSMRLN